MQKRRVEELNVLDDFLFGSIVSYPGIGERFCKKLLRIILGEDVKDVRIVPQRVYYGNDTDRHGTRLDICIEGEGPEQVGTVYDIEPDQNSRAKKVEALPKRVRFYRAKIDGDSLQAGYDYQCLKRVVIILITNYDPFGRNRMVYTVKSMCREELDLPYDDGAVTIFLYTQGNKGNPPEEMRRLLRYLEDSSEANAVDQDIKEIHSMVEKVKQDKEVSLEYMKIFEREQLIREDGREEGLQEGREEGKEEGVNRINELNRRLIRDGRSAELILAVQDEELQKELLEEYNL